MEPVALILPTIVSLAVAQILGYLWYGPLMFGNRWLNAMKVSNPKFKPQTDLSVVLLSSLAWTTSAVMFSWLRAMAGFDGLRELFALAAAGWLLFSVPNGVFSVLFEDRNSEVAIIGQAYLLVSFVFMAMTHWLL
jgi:hypothetical protein